MFLCKFYEIFKNTFFFWITFRDCFGFWQFVNLVWLTLKIQYMLVICLRFIIFWFWWLMINGCVFMSTKYGWWLVVLDIGNNLSVKLWQLSNYYCWWEVVHIGESKRNGCKSSWKVIGCGCWCCLYLCHHKSVQILTVEVSIFS